MIFNITHQSDLNDALKELKGHRYPYYLTIQSGKALTKEWNELNAFFHVSVVPLFSSLTGYERHEAKEQLQILNALVEEHPDYYEVESISGMSYDRLVKFIESCQRIMMKSFGVCAIGTPIVKTKKILK